MDRPLLYESDRRENLYILKAPAVIEENKTLPVQTKSSLHMLRRRHFRRRERASIHKTMQDRYSLLQRTSIWYLVIVFLACPHILAATHGKEGMVSASEVPKQKRSQSAMAAAIESFQGSNLPQAFLGINWPSREASNSQGVGQDRQHISSLPFGGDNNQSSQPVETVEVTFVQDAPDVSQNRWGQTAVYLPESGIVMFTGGQMRSQDGQAIITNDVFALDVSSKASSAKRQATNNRWTRLSSANLPPHAFAAKAVTHTGNHQGEQLYLIGGATADCSISNSPVYMWQSGESGDWRSGQWTAPYIAPGAVIPPRRRNAMAVQVPVKLGLGSEDASKVEEAGGISFMVLGGATDTTTCNSTGNTPSAQYQAVDVWTLVKGTGTKRADDHAPPTMQVRSLPIDPRMPNMSISDYTTVVVPANESAQTGSRVVFIGGRNAEGSFTPMNQLWSLDVETSTWHRIDTTNGSDSGLDIPLGRMGHSSNILADGTVLIHGGYTTQDAKRNASADTHLLDLRQQPAVWKKVENPNAKSQGPARAFHSSVLVDGILVMGFGQQSEGYDTSNIGSRQAVQDTSLPTDSASAVSKGVDSNSLSLVQYLDTSSTQPWTWSQDFDAVLTSREAQAAEDASPSSSTSPSDTSSSLSSDASSASNQPSSTKASKESNSAKPEPKKVPDDDDGDDGDDDDNETDAANKKRDTAVIASVLGAAAAAAALGGLYLHKRRKANGSDSDTLSSDDDKYERFNADATSAQAAPLVSSLWINQPVAWANNAGRGLKRHASMASEAFLQRTKSSRRAPGNQNAPWRAFSSPAESDETRFTSPPHGAGSFQVLRNVPRQSRFSIRRTVSRRERTMNAHAESENEDEKMFDILGDSYEGNQQALPDAFISSLLDDDDLRAKSDIQRTVGGGNEDDNGDHLASLHTLSKTPSTASLSVVSGDNASHFSYPYLTAMHQASQADASSTYQELQNFHGGVSPSSTRAAGLCSAEQSPQDEQISPREALMRASFSQGNYQGDVIHPSADQGKNALLMERTLVPATTNVAFANPFDDPDQISFMEAKEQQRDPTELDFTSTVVSRRPDAFEKELQSPSARVAAMATTMGSPLPVWGQPQRRSSRLLHVTAGNARQLRLPRYQQPSGMPHIPFNPFLLDIASQQANSARASSRNRARPSLLRVTNEGDS